MLTSIKQNLQNAGIYFPYSFWVDFVLLGLSLPFLIFPTRYALATALFLVIWLIRWLTEIIHGLELKQSSFTLLILMFAAWSIVPIVVTADPDLTLDKATGLLLGFLVWRIIRSHFHTTETVQLLAIATSILGTAFVGIGFLAVDWLEKVPALSALVNLFPQQVISFSAIGSGQGVQPNQLAGTLLWLYPFTAGLTVWFWQKKQILIAISGGIITLIFLLLLVLSQSRGGWLGGLAAFGIGIWLSTFGLSANRPLSHGKWVIPIGVIFVAATIFLFFGPELLVNLWIDPPDASLVGDLESLSFRQEVWFWAVQAISDFPLTGTGLGSFRQTVQRLYPIAIPATYDIAHAHNVFLQVALDTGLIGLVIYLAILFTYFRQGFRSLLINSTYRPVIIGLMAAFAGFHLYGLVDTISLGAKPALIFWLLICIMDRTTLLDSAEM